LAAPRWGSAKEPTRTRRDDCSFAEARLPLALMDSLASTRDRLPEQRLGLRDKPVKRPLRTITTLGQFRDPRVEIRRRLEGDVRRTQQRTFGEPFEREPELTLALLLPVTFVTVANRLQVGRYKAVDIKLVDNHV
jgi:hypothetical protein